MRMGSGGHVDEMYEPRCSGTESRNHCERLDDSLSSLNERTIANRTSVACMLRREHTRTERNERVSERTRTQHARRMQGKSVADLRREHTRTERNEWLSAKAASRAKRAEKLSGGRCPRQRDGKEEKKERKENASANRVTGEVTVSNRRGNCYILPPLRHSSVL